MGHVWFLVCAGSAAAKHGKATVCSLVGDLLHAFWYACPGFGVACHMTHMTSMLGLMGLGMLELRSKQLHTQAAT